VEYPRQIVKRLLSSVNSAELNFTNAQPPQILLRELMHMNVRLMDIVSGWNMKHCSL